MKKIRCLSAGETKATRKEKIRVAYELRHKYSLVSLLKLLKIAKSSYFYEIKTYERIDKEQEIKTEILDIFNKNQKRYGCPRITLELQNRGYRINHKKVQRLMKVMGLKAKQPRAKYKSYKGELSPICDNKLLEVVNNKVIRNFSTSRCNEKWTTDVSEFHIPAGKLYLSPILDMHNREIISYSISRNPSFNQTIDMLNKAFEQYDNLEGLIFHSDQGWQYQMNKYKEILNEKGIIQSMSRKGNCLDNSLMENFFGIMKNEMFYGHEYEFESLDQLEKAMIEYIEYYNNQRITVKLKGLSPYNYRQQSLNQLICA
ncbi:MAG: IS3 family transposase [Bacilli bacterium]